MCSWTLRPFVVPDDFPRLAEIYTACAPEPTTVANLEEQEAKAKYERQLRLVAVDAEGRMGGFGHAQRSAEDPAGQYSVKVWVDQACRGLGAGRLLADALEQWAAEQGARRLETWVRESFPESVAFAKQRGFTVDRHLFESKLDPRAFDAAPFAGTVERVAATGIRFFTLADQPGEATERALYELYQRTAWDIPGFELEKYPPFADWRDWVVAGRQSRPDLILLAADGDYLAGCTAMFPNEVTGALYIDYTCVDREYRGRGIALALKLLAVDAARRIGAPYIRTNNDSENAPMLAVNRKLGYVPQPGMYRMRKPVTVQVRPLDPERDAEAVAPLWQYVESDPPSPEELLQAWRRIPEGGQRHRLVATDLTGRVIGYAGAGRDPWDQPGRWYVRVIVTPAFRGRGIGSDLFRQVTERAAAEGAAIWQAEVRDSDEASRAWAEHRGFAVTRHTFESVLDLTAFDAAPYGDVAAATGLRFFTRAEDPSEATARQCWELMSRTVFDIPGVTLARPQEFPDWAQWALDEELHPADSFIIAADGDRVVGMTMLEPRMGGGMYTSGTSVDREYRGRGVALALKLASIRAAKGRGAPYMRTHNDSQNAPMLAVNRKLGYRAEPGLFALEKRAD